MPAKTINASTLVRAASGEGSHPDVSFGLARRSAKRDCSRQTGSHLGNSGLRPLP